MEHVERQDEREQELKGEVDRLEQQGDELEERGEHMEHEIGQVREEIEQRKSSGDAPGLQEEGKPTGEPPGDATGDAPRTDDDESAPRMEEDE